MSQGWLLCSLNSEHFSFILRIKKNYLSTKPRLLSLPLSLLWVKKDFHISALEQSVAQQISGTIKSWVRESAHSPGTLASPSQRGKEKLLQKTTVSGKAFPSPKASCNFLHHIYCKQLQHFCSSPNWECGGKNNPFSPYYTLWNTLGPVGQTIPEALSGLGPFCDVGRCMVLCQWRYCTHRRHSRCYSSRQLGEGSGFWVREQGSKTKHSSRDGVTAQR